MRGMRRPLRHVASVITLGFGLVATVAMQPQAATIRALGDDGSARSFIAQRNVGVSLRRAMAIALGRYPGRVVRAQTMSRGDRIVHEIRILDDEGRVRTVQIDAKTGQFL